MRTSESTLRVLRTLAQAELAEAATAVAIASAGRRDACRTVDMLAEHYGSATREMRKVLQRRQIDPSLVGAMRALYLRSGGWLREKEGVFSAAEQRELQARAVFADISNRDRSLELALKQERKLRRMQRETLQMRRLDESWLQRARRER